MPPDLETESSYTEGIQFGEVLLTLNDGGNNKYFMEFIRSLGYNSFTHFQDYGTNFVTERGDYGSCYGVYDPGAIKFVDGPF